jgi:hypothetical protein
LGNDFVAVSLNAYGFEFEGPDESVEVDLAREDMMDIY